MAFKKGAEWNGNAEGRGRVKRTEKELKTQDLERLYRQLKGFSRDTIKLAADIMNKNTATDQMRLKAAIFLLQEYVKLNQELSSDVETEDEDDGKGAVIKPLFSLTVLDSKTNDDGE